MDNTKEFTCLSLCSGYGGLELGLKRACPNVRTVCYVEVEAFACANLVAKMEKGFLDVAPIWTDIKTFDGRHFRGKVDIITAGYPCQGESVAGKRLGKADPRWLWPHIERIIEAVRPVWFFGENVSGHLALGFPEVYRSLRNLGYTVEAGLFTAAECGAPHRRERLFILAHNPGGRCEDVQIQQARQSALGIHSQDLVHARSTKSTGLSDCQRKEDSTIGRTGPMANTENPNRGRTRRKANNGRGYKEIGGQNNNQWPARPGQSQYEWEEPRVVANTKQRCRRGQDGDTQRLQCEIQTTRPNKRQAQPNVGRTAYGTSSRVDRLRLLGNGIVPQQAEKAFRYLIRMSEKRIAAAKDCFGLLEIGK